MIFVWVIAIFVLVIFLLDQLIERMYHNEKKSSQLTPQKYAIPFDEIHIPAKNGAQLHGWWMPASPHAPTLILIHGWGRNLSRMMPYIRALHPYRCIASSNVDTQNSVSIVFDNRQLTIFRE